ncbi:quinone-dependent dihydroorotate dehydrogenase [Brackiella oedipodis]|uniref:quinone-dependent dihydroorotate dehydrogenase n=1 Tax=Brackiella oedipodis TaxID=124225 RepID=UPI00056E955F|nr:quinone-dependent dihydroorotate dehydrogenase [Brackiella oedipodis]
MRLQLDLSPLYPLIKPLLFAMDAEAAHHFTLKSLAKWQQLSPSKPEFAGQAQTVMGLQFPNRVGLAAGLDKNGAYIDALGALGFGFLEVGTVTPKPQAGNPKPRLFRVPQVHGIINRMGFNNDGLETFLDNVKKSQWRSHGGILGLNIGKNATTPIERAHEDYLIGLRGVYPYADYVSVNISSPNTKNLRDLQQGESLGVLLSALQAEREQLQQQHGFKVPLLLKIAPDLDSEQVTQIAELVLKHHIDGIIACNTTLSRRTIADLKIAQEAGGLSGPAVHEMSLQVIRQLRQVLGQDVAIIGVGGIENRSQAVAKIAAGADLVQIYTGLIYQGPALISDCAAALAHSK